MNTKNKWYLPILLGLIFIASGCTEGYLEQKPDGRLALSALERLAKTLVNAYPTDCYNFTDWMSDNADYLPQGDSHGFDRDIYEWKVCNNATNQDCPNNYWTVSYYAIAHANVVLDKIKDIKGGDTAYKNAIIGEALLCRAYAHFMLVSLFAKPYNKETASSDLGIPYVTKVEKQIIVPYQRNTVQEVYDLVEKDLLKGLQLVSSQYYKHSGKFHFTKESALAFASRFYLWKGGEKENYKKAEEYATQLLGEDESQFVRNYEDIIAEGDWNPIRQSYCKISLPANLLLATTHIYFKPSHYNSGYGCTKEVYQKAFPYGDDDRRGFTYMQRTGGYLIARFRYFYPPSVGHYIMTQILFTGEEVILNRAEARLMQGDIAGAEHDITLSLSTRYESEKSLDFFKEKIKDLSEKDKLLKIILEQRRAEFFSEGLRWFDIRRFHLTVTHKLEDGTEDTLTRDDPRKVLQIPSNAIQFGVKPNPRPSPRDKERAHQK